jgi:Kelch motif
VKKRCSSKCIILLLLLLLFLIVFYLCFFSFLFKFLGPWEKYRIKPGGSVAVAQGGAIGNDLIVFGGYANGGLSSATNQTWVYDTLQQKWHECDPIPIPLGITHMPNVIVNNSHIYACGGYLSGTNPGFPAQKQCFVYTHGNTMGTQWKSLPDLPDIRAGGAMIYNTKQNSIIYATGADFHSPNPPRQVDWPTVWELDLDYIMNGWKERTNTPYIANHVGTTTVLYQGIERHYIVGGQEAHNEYSGQYHYLYEYDANNNDWIQRANLPTGTSHIQSSVFSYKDCGMFVIGGKHNRNQVSKSVLYYDIATNQWYKIGDTPSKISATVCDIMNDTMIYCQSGCIGCNFSWRIQIE